MKKIFIAICLLLAVSCCLTACSKNSDSNPNPTTTKLSATLATDWTTSAWGGENNNPMNFTIDATTDIGTITYLSTDKFNFAVGDKLFTNITANADGTFSAKGKFTYGTNNENTSIRNCTLSLQNNGKQLTAFYPAIPNFPDLTYIFQQGSTTVVLL